MLRDRCRVTALCLASFAVGTIGWSGHILLLPTAMLFPAVWSLAGTRTQAAIFAAGYFLAASRGLPQGVATYYATDLWPGLLLWVVASSGFVVVHAGLWTRQTGLPISLRYLATCLIMSFPPFGILGWANPLTAAGVLFPGWGWFGLLATAAGLAVMTTDLRPACTVAFGVFWIWSVMVWTTPVAPATWYAVDSQFGASNGRDANLRRQRELATTLLARRTSGASIALLPESTFGFWTPTVEHFWERQLQGTGLTVVAGATVVNSMGYDNVLVSVSETAGDILYRERMPVPGSMWQPWRFWFGEDHGALAHYFDNPLVTVGGSRVAPLICYEQLLVWPILQSMLYDPDVIIAVGNDWWTTGTSVIDIQRASTMAWASLFNKALVISFNS